MATSQINRVIQHLGRAMLLRNCAELTDRQLLENYIKRRDETALAALVQRHGPMVWGICRRMLSNHHDAEDAFQATFLVLVRKAASIASPELFANWLFGVAHQTALKARGNGLKRKARERQVTGMPEPAVEPDLWNDLQPLLDRELSRLPDSYRVVIVLCELEGKTRKEAARQLGLPEGTVGSRLARARVLLAKRLTQRGITLSGGALAALLTQNVSSAGVPASVVSNTICAACVFAAGRAAAAGVISPTVAALTEGVLKAMLLSKLKIATALIVVVGLFGFALTKLDYPAFADGQAQADPTPPAGQLPTALVSQERETGWRLQATLQGHKDEVPCLAFGVDHLATASKDGSIKLWHISKAKEERAIRYAVELGPMRSMSITPDGKHALLIIGDHLGFWDTSKDKFPKAAIGGAAPVAFTSTSDGYAVVLRRTLEREDAKKLQVWTVSGFGSVNGELGFGPIESTGFYSHSSDVETVCLSQGAEILAAATADHTITLWDVDTKKEQAVCKGHTGSVLAVEFSPDRKTLASASKDSTVRLWDTETGKELAVLKGHEGQVNCVAFSPDGSTLASGGDDKTVAVWDVKAAKKLVTLSGHTDVVLRVAFSRGGEILASGSRDQTVRLWESTK